MQRFTKYLIHFLKSLVNKALPNKFNKTTTIFMSISSCPYFIPIEINWAFEKLYPTYVCVLKNKKIKRLFVKMALPEATRCKVSFRKCFLLIFLLST